MDRNSVGQERSKVVSDLLRPLLHTGTPFYAFVGILILLIAWFMYSWITQLAVGLGATSMRTPVGASWGVYIVNFVFYVGIAHGGIAIAAAIRLLKLNNFQPIARIGEVLTIVGLMMGGMSIVCDMGRPDRIFNMLLYWPQRIGYSSLSWDITLIFLYFILCASFLWLTLRKDLARLAQRFPRRGPIYKLLAIGYRPDEGAKIERITWWLSIAIVFLVVMLSGGVVPWIFGLLPSRPGWYGAMAGPYFLNASIASAIAAVIVASGILRWVFKWKAYIKPQIFKGLGVFLGVITLFYLYLVLSEQLTMRYAAPLSEFLVSEMLLGEKFGPIYWPMLIVGLFIPAVYLIIQSVYKKWFGVTRIVVAAGAIVLALWIKRFFIVVPSLLLPLLPFSEGDYSPSWVEWSIVIGLFAIAVLLFTLFMKLFPIMEMPEE